MAETPRIPTIDPITNKIREQFLPDISGSEIIDYGKGLLKVVDDKGQDRFLVPLTYEWSTLPARYIPSLIGNIDLKWDGSGVDAQIETASARGGLIHAVATNGAQETYHAATNTFINLKSNVQYARLTGEITYFRLKEYSGNLRSVDVYGNPSLVHLHLGKLNHNDSKYLSYSTLANLTRLFISDSNAPISLQINNCPFMYHFTIKDCPNLTTVSLYDLPELFRITINGTSPLRDSSTYPGGSTAWLNAWKNMMQYVNKEPNQYGEYRWIRFLPSISSGDKTTLQNWFNSNGYAWTIVSG